MAASAPLRKRKNAADPAPRAANDALHPPLGQLLVERGLLTPEDKLRTLEMQAYHDAPIGELLVARGLLSREAVDRELARQFSTETARFSEIPPDVALIDRLGVDRVLALGLLPWQRRNGKVLIAATRVVQFDRMRPELEVLFGDVQMVVTNQTELHHAVIARHLRALAEKAEIRVNLRESCRNWSVKHAVVIASSLGGLAAGAMVAPMVVFYGLLIWTLVFMIAQTSLKAAAFLLPRPKASTLAEVPVTRLPIVSVLVPLFKEREIAAHLIKRLERIDYPRALLDICLVVESDDATTQTALEAAELPSHIRRIVVPEAKLRTKPRALNYALEFCRGSIIGVYDAEDAPAPDQLLRVVEHFHAAPPEVACVQGVLDYYNPHRNWLSRCFTVEYAAWFRAILPGFLRLGLAIPLGGTTLFFRRRVLENLGGWDAHNVTEDADLGFRLARHGYRCELIETVTEEEANCALWPWIKQRSRWLKGYAVTWAVHARNPLRLIRDIGLWRSCGLHLLLLGTLTQFAVAPLLWTFWLLTLGLGHPVTQDLGAAAIWGIAGVFIVSETLDFIIRFWAVGQTRHRNLRRWVPTLYFYFPLATLAAYKAVFELVTKPFYWDKTSHGRDQASEAGLRRRSSKRAQRS